MKFKFDGKDSIPLSVPEIQIIISISMKLIGKMLALMKTITGVDIYFQQLISDDLGKTMKKGHLRPVVKFFF